MSHHHGDHCNVPTISALAQGRRDHAGVAALMFEESYANVVPQERLIVPEPGHPFAIKGIAVEPIHAIHGNQEFTVLTREPDFVESIRSNCGYVLNILGNDSFTPAIRFLQKSILV